MSFMDDLLEEFPEFEGLQDQDLDNAIKSADKKRLGKVYKKSRLKEGYDGPNYFYVYEGSFDKEMIDNSITLLDLELQYFNFQKRSDKSRIKEPICEFFSHWVNWIDDEGRFINATLTSLKYILHNYVDMDIHDISLKYFPHELEFSRDMRTLTLVPGEGLTEEDVDRSRKTIYSEVNKLIEENIKNTNYPKVISIEDLDDPNLDYTIIIHNREHMDRIKLREFDKDLNEVAERDVFKDMILKFKDEVIEKMTNFIKELRDGVTSNGND